MEVSLAECCAVQKNPASAHLGDNLPVALPGALEQQQLEAAARPGVGCNDEALIDLPLGHRQLVEGCGGLVDLHHPQGQGQLPKSRLNSVMCESLWMHHWGWPVHARHRPWTAWTAASAWVNGTPSICAVIGQGWGCSMVLHAGRGRLRRVDRTAPLQGTPKGSGEACTLPSKALSRRWGATAVLMGTPASAVA